MFKRTEGVSTTDIVGKLLMLTKDNRGSGRGRQNSMEKPMLSSEYVKELRKLEDEESKNESYESPIQKKRTLAKSQSDDWLSQLSVPKA